jgi:hypothetical protein
MNDQNIGCLTTFKATRRIHQNGKTDYVFEYTYPEDIDDERAKEDATGLGMRYIFTLPI